MTLIHHITHIANLASIIERGELACDAAVERENLCEQSIAYDSIKERRRNRLVETLAGKKIAAGGVLPDYVPFYFSNRTPMLGAIHRGLVPAFQGRQNDVVYLVSTAEAVAATDSQRTQAKRRKLIVQQARLCLLRHRPNLASRVLGESVRHLPDWWHGKHSYTPLLAATFVDPERFEGTCYRAAEEERQRGK